MERKSRLLPAFVLVACIVLIVPVGIVVVLSFSGDDFLTFPPKSYSLRWFHAFLGDPRWRDALSFSFIVAVLSSVLSTFAGFLASYAYLRRSFAFKETFMAAMLLPIIAPTVITSIAMYFLAVHLGLVGNLFWLAFCHGVISIPVVVLIMVSGLRTLDVNLERAAFGLGASRFYVFCHVIIPLSFTSIVSSLLFAFLASFDELIISLFLSGTRSPTLPVMIWNSLHLEIEPVIAAVSTFLIGVTCLILLANYLLMRGRPQSGTSS